jgi:hypothetical protein
MNKLSMPVLLLLLLISCEKKIEIHPENSEKKVFVESIFSDLPAGSYVKLSETKGIYESITNHQVISDATVKLIDKTNGDIIDFTYVASEAKYLTNTPGIIGHEYELSIDAQGQHISALKTMTSLVPLQRVISIPATGESGKFSIQLQFDDPENQEDYYLVIIQPADPSSGLEPTFTVLSDYLYNRTEHTIDVQDEVFDEGTDWFVLFYHIDKKNYDYLKVILRAMKSLVNGSHPFYGLSLGNPVSTVEGEQTMGFFLVSPVAFSPIHIGN